MNPNVEKLQSSATLALNAKAQTLKAQGKEVFNLTLGEPDQRCPKFVEDAMKKAIDEGQHKYLPAGGLPKLKQKLAEFYGKRWNMTLNPENFIINNGAKHSLFNTIFCKLKTSGQRIGCISPYWLSYPALATIANAEFVPLQRNMILNQLAKLDCLILNFPSNPTGESYRMEEIKPIVEKYFQLNPGGFVISDEIYEFLTFEHDHESLGGEFPEKDIVIVNGFSKSYKMTGLRVGWTYYRNQKDVSKINAFQSHTTSNVNSVAQFGALAALDIPPEYYGELKQVYKKRAESAVQICRKFLPKAEICIPGGAFYLWIDVSKYGMDGTRFCDLALQEANVLGVPGDEFGSKNHVRYSIACAEDYFAKAMEKLSKVFV